METFSSTSSNSVLRLPLEFRRNMGAALSKRNVKKIVRENRLVTVCEEARCPNIGECFSNNTATFMIMGDTCTRRCHFCSVKTGKPKPLDRLEPMSVALAVEQMDLDYVVITSVDRDELVDLGVGHFIKVVNAVKERCPSARIELLTPDFKGRHDLVKDLLKAPIDVFGHNIETIERIYKKLRPQSNFTITSELLRFAASKGKVVKSGMMVGVGEEDDEVLENISLLKALGVNIVTIGQYLRPSLKHWPVARYVGQESYLKFMEYGKKIGISNVYAGPWVRSSYHAKEAFHNS